MLKSEARPAVTADQRLARRHRLGTAVVAVALVLAALNLRPAISSVGPLLAEVRSGLGMSGAVAGLLTALPALCFVIFGSAAPRVSRRVGPAAAVGVGMATVAIGLALRPFVSGGTGAFVAFSCLALAGIGVSNVLMPVLVKRYFPHRVGVMTGAYSMALALGTSAAAATTVPLAAAFGDWRWGLAFWAVPAALAALVWLGLVRDRPSQPSPSPVPTSAGTSLRLTKSPTAWALAVFFGIQATGGYVAMGWLPQIFRDAGISAQTAGLLLAATPAIGIPLAFALPAVAGRLRQQSGLAVGLTAVGLIAYGGLWLAPAAAPWLWVVLLGISQSTFPLALTMIALRARTPAGVVRLSAFAQGIGYFISIPGPIVVGVLYQYTGGWSVALGLMIALLVPQAIVGGLAGRNREVEREA